MQLRQKDFQTNPGIHKSYWISALRDSEDTREVKALFVRDLGFSTAEEAASFLELIPQTTFVGRWLVTDDELIAEGVKEASGQHSIFSVTTPPDRIYILSEEIHDASCSVEALDDYLHTLRRRDSEAADHALFLIKKLLILACAQGESAAHTLAVNILGQLQESASSHADLAALLEIADHFFVYALDGVLELDGL
jgi:hypothetical protein